MILHNHKRQMSGSVNPFLIEHLPPLHNHRHPVAQTISDMRSVAGAKSSPAVYTSHNQIEIMRCSLPSESVGAA